MNICCALVKKCVKSIPFCKIKEEVVCVVSVILSVLILCHVYGGSYAFSAWSICNVHDTSVLNQLSLSLSNGATAQGGPWPPLGVSFILPGLGRLLSNFCILASLHLPPLHLPNAVWVSLWGVFLLAHWEELSWIDHHHPGVRHVLPISVYSTCRISQCHV